MAQGGLIENIQYIHSWDDMFAVIDRDSRHLLEFGLGDNPEGYQEGYETRKVIC